MVSEVIQAVRTVCEDLERARIIITAQQNLTYVAATGTGNDLKAMRQNNFNLVFEQLVFTFC